MSLFQVASRRPLVINSVTALDATQDELIVVATLRLIAENRYEQASGQLRNLERSAKFKDHQSLHECCCVVQRNNCPSIKDPIWL